uniref:Uncharacterized protein n=1 Tax=Parascaris equorum TaxID=6256 RepID=A0A914S361_PAREQ
MGNDHNNDDDGDQVDDDDGDDEMSANSIECSSVVLFYGTLKHIPLSEDALMQQPIKATPFNERIR